MPISRRAICFLALLPPLPPGVTVEESPKDPKASKVVLVAGSNYYKPGEHEYIGGCAVLMDLLRQTPGVAPVLAVDWPEKPETFAGAKAVVFFLDGAEKHTLLKGKRMEEIQKLADDGVGLVLLHQAIDLPKDFGERVRSLAGASWEKGFSQRAHWVAEFATFPDHPVMRGVTPFKIDDGWLYQMRFGPERKSLTPLLSTVSPKAKAKRSADGATVGWAFERGKGRTFVFTGCHLHRSFIEEGFRRFLVNGILWSAGQEIPKTGAPVGLDAATLDRYLVKRPAK